MIETRPCDYCGADAYIAPVRFAVGRKLACGSCFRANVTPGRQPRWPIFVAVVLVVVLGTLIAYDLREVIFGQG